MAFGIKIRNVKTKGSYSIESLYEAIKDYDFTAGKPSIVKYASAEMIAFPALDNQNQVWILKSGVHKESQKFSVQKGEASGIADLATASFADNLTGGLFGMTSMVGKNVKKCEKLVEATAKELKEMDL